MSYPILCNFKYFIWEVNEFSLDFRIFFFILQGGIISFFLVKCFELQLCYGTQKKPHTSYGKYLVEHPLPQLGRMPDCLFSISSLWLLLSYLEHYQPCLVHRRRRNGRRSDHPACLSTTIRLHASIDQVQLHSSGKFLWLYTTVR